MSASDPPDPPAEPPAESPAEPSAGPSADPPVKPPTRPAPSRSSMAKADPTEELDARDLIEAVDATEEIDAHQVIESVDAIAAPPAPAPADLHARRVSVEVAIYEPDDEARSLASAGILGLGYKLLPPLAEDQLKQRLSATDAPDVVLLALPEGAAIAAAAAAFGPARPVLVGSLSGPALTARPRSKGSDLFTVKPHTTESLAPIMHAATLLASERQRLRVVEGNEKRLRERLQAYGKGDPVTGFQHFEFFQHHLVRELERARHFGYSLALCLIGLDPWQGDAPPTAATADKVRASVARAISAVIRPVDSPVDFAEDRFLVFMPYTEIEAAETAGQRILRAVRSCELVREGGRIIRLSVSVGISALQPGEAVSFSRLVRDAGTAMRAAQLKGGDRVVVR